MADVTKTLVGVNVSGMLVTVTYQYQITLQDGTPIPPSKEVATFNLEPPYISHEGDSARFGGTFGAGSEFSLVANGASIPVSVIADTQHYEMSALIQQVVGDTIYVMTESVDNDDGTFYSKVSLQAASDGTPIPITTASGNVILAVALPDDVKAALQAVLDA